MSLFAPAPGKHRSRLCTPCEAIQQQAESAGSAKQCQRCRQIRPLAEFPGRQGREHGLLCITCLGTSISRGQAVRVQLGPVPPVPLAMRTEGLCMPGNVRPGLAGIWSSDRREDRELARQVCRSCAASSWCLEWSLTAVGRADNAIYASLGAFGRNRVRRSRRRPAAIPEQPDAARETATA